MKLRELTPGWIVLALVSVVINLGLLALSVWLVVKVLQWTGVLQP